MYKGMYKIDTNKQFENSRFFNVESVFFFIEQCCVSFTTQPSLERLLRHDPKIFSPYPQLNNHLQVLLPLLQALCHGQAGSHLGISSWGGGGKLTDHVALRPWQGEGRLHNYNIFGEGGGGGGGGVGSVWGGSWVSLGGKLSCLGGKLPPPPPPPPPPPQDETLAGPFMPPTKYC